jgi:putative flavoprotein involved in K+ transport
MKAISSGMAEQEVRTWLQHWTEALRTGDAGALDNLFDTECFWRDLVAFSWNITTAEGKAEIRAMFAATWSTARSGQWMVDGSAVATPDGGVEAWLTFETGAGRGRAHVRLRVGRCHTLLTALRELKGFEEPAGPRRPMGTVHGYGPPRPTWAEQRAAEAARLGRETQPYCLIVGGGQGGIALAARLKRLQVPTLVVDRLPRPGDAWRRRYRSLCLHDPVWYDHLPYLPFPDHWPVFTPKDKLADWLEAYTKVMELDYWSSTSCRKARFDDGAGVWEVEVERDGHIETLRPRQLVFALGVSGYPVVPEIPGSRTFLGEQHHSSAHPGGDRWRGKRCVVLGSNNSAHDIAAELWEHGAQVTMIQRSGTLVVKSETIVELVLGRLYSEAAVRAGIDVERADLIAASLPMRLVPRVAIPLWQEIARRDADFYDRLRAVGFLLDFGEDGAGLQGKYLRRGSGYYIDVGASELVANGSISLRSGVSIASMQPDGVTLTSGERLPADLVVHATGYGSMNNWLADLVSPEVADRVGKCWGLGSETAKDPGPWEGELRNMWKPTAQEALWLHGGNLSQSRHFSLYLALQIKARMEGIETPVYGRAAVHHLR